MPKRYSYSLEGLRTVEQNLKKALDQIKGQTKAGLLEAGLLVQRRSQELVPVDTGHLKGSAYIEPTDLPNGPVVEVGYGAEYATHVHERLELHHPQGQAKYLETAIKESVDDILKIIAAGARIP